MSNLISDLKRSYFRLKPATHFGYHDELGTRYFILRSLLKNIISYDDEQSSILISAACCKIWNICTD